MSHCKRGRKPKSAFSSNGDTIEIERFYRIAFETLAFFPWTNITKWSLKKEWAEFSKSRPKEKFIKNAYDFFKRDEGYTNNLIETDFHHISMVLRKIDNNVSVYYFFRRKNAPLHQFIVKSLRG